MAFKLKFETTLDYFIFFIVVIKIVFIGSMLGSKLIQHGGMGSKETLAKLEYWKERSEFIFIAAMAMLLIYHFRGGRVRPIGHETALLFMLFGWILLFTAKWSLFFHEAPWFKHLASVLR